MELISTGSLDVEWIHGSKFYKKKTDPLIQVHYYNENTLIMRQSKDVSGEAPFMYLLLGKEKAILIDTGATKDENKFPLRKTIDKEIRIWLDHYPQKNYELIICHTHGHNDHTAGDYQFLQRPNTILITKDLDSVKIFFKIDNWPDTNGSINLGDRKLDIIPTPGHDPREISIYDHLTKILITGDLVYPGRLYAFDFPTFVESLNKLVHFTEQHEILYILGCHLEMTKTSKKAYPINASYQPNEPKLEMTVEQLVTIRDTAKKIGNKGGIYTSDDFIIWSGPCYRSAMILLVKGFLYNFKYRLGLIKE